MAKGQASKEYITKKILETFSNSFTYDKEIRIPCEEEGEPLQIKITLTAAKTMVYPEGTEPEEEQGPSANANVSEVMTEPTPEEKATVAELLQRLGL